MSVNFLKYKTIYLSLIAVLSLASILSVSIFGLKPGIDFTGGSIMEIEYKTERPQNQAIEQSLVGLDLGLASVQPTGEYGVILRMRTIDEATHQLVLQKIGASNIEERRFESVGAVIGRELERKTVILIVVSLLAIVIYIALAFRKVQRPVKSWQYALSSLVCLFHDVLITLGVFAILGKYFGVEISIAVITALLTVVGCSINNVIVVFDRVRENIIKGRGANFEDTINQSINQTLGRCFNTSFAYLLPLVAIFFFGGATLKYFALALILGIIAGTYSAPFLAGPMLALWQKRRNS